MQGAVDQQDPVSFSDPKVSTVIQKWRRDTEARSASASDELQPVYPDWLLPSAPSTTAVTNDPRETASIFDEETAHSSSNVSKTLSFPSTKTTPSKRRGRSWEIARRNLLAWLLVTGHFRCHATSTTPAARMLVQVAHILLPRSAAQDEQLLLWYEFLLGMAPRSLRIHSRIFMMPLRADIHALLDGHKVIIVPTLDLLRKIDAYLQLVHSIRLRDKLEARFANITLDSEVPVPFKDLWRLLRAKKNILGVDNSHASSIDHFKHFEDGRFNSFRLVPHPTLDSNTQPTLAAFSSHLSPFAATMNALQTLAKWSCDPVPTPSVAMSSSRGIVLEQALALCMTHTEAADISKAFAAIYVVVQQLEQEFKEQVSFRHVLRTSRSRGDDDGGDGGARGDDDDDVFNQPNPSDRSGFGFGNLVFSSSPSHPTGASTSTHPQAHDTSYQHQLQSHAVYAFRRPLTSIPSSQWGSDTDSTSGTEAIEMIKADCDHADGDAALDIADAWRREHNTSSSVPPLTLSPSVEETHATQMHDGSQEMTTMTRNAHNSSSAKVTMSETASSSLSRAAKKVLLGKSVVYVFKSLRHRLVRSNGLSSS